MSIVKDIQCWIHVEKEDIIGRISGDVDIRKLMSKHDHIDSTLSWNILPILSILNINGPLGVRFSLPRCIGIGISDVPQEVLLNNGISLFCRGRTTQNKRRNEKNGKNAFHKEKNNSQILLILIIR